MLEGIERESTAECDLEYVWVLKAYVEWSS